MSPRIKNLILALAIATPCATPVSAQQLNVPVLEQQAKAGDMSAQMKLARTYDLGTDVAQNFALARKYFHAAAMQGNTDAQNRLGQLLRSGLGGDVDAEQAMAWLTRAAKKGNAAHLFDLALMYEQGFGTAQDYTQAAKLYAQAATKNHAEAQVKLGVYYQNGTGVELDPNKARKLFQGLAEAGNAEAQNNLGLLYVRGEGVIQDYEIAFGWFEKAANSGLKTAMTNLGVMYENGFGVAFSDAEAAKWYRLGGGDDSGNSGAEIPYSFIIDNRIALGEFTQKNLASELAKAKAGDPVSMYILAAVTIMGPPELYDANAGSFWLDQAAKAGLTSAQANMALLYQHGIGVPQDFTMAYMWASLASVGDKAAFGAIKKELLHKLTPGQINEAQELASKL